MTDEVREAVTPRSVATAVHGWLRPHLKHMVSFNVLEDVVAEAMATPLNTDEGGCVTKRFVIFATPGRVPEKKGGWLNDGQLIEFLREVVLHDGWKPGFQATVLELTWDSDLWASSALEYLSMHDHAIGPRRARKEWIAAREKHERIYGQAPKSKLGSEVASFLSTLSPKGEAEAVAWRWRSKGTNWVYGPDMPVWASSDDCDEIIQPLYAHPSAPKAGDREALRHTLEKRLADFATAALHGAGLPAFIHPDAEPVRVEADALAALTQGDAG